MAIPVITVAQMREWEKATWASGQTEEAVMRRAGEAAARVAERLTASGEFIIGLAGKGHNGDDTGFAIEQIKDRQVQLLKVVDPEATVRELGPLLERRPALILDGLFGIGLNRGLGMGWIKLMQKINSSGIRVLAVDVPSGLNADSGLPLEEAVRATTTVTFGAVKQGLLNSSSWPFVGRLEAAPEIGLIPYPFSTEISVIDPEDFRNFPPTREQAGHKGTYGHVVVVAGSLGYHGAAVLATRGAQRAQPGLVTLITAPNVYAPVAGQCQAAMVRPWSPDMTLLESCTAVVAGPGLAAQDVPPYVKDFVARLWQQSPLTVVLDATALGWIQPGAPANNCGLRVLTPHPGEAARMLGNSTPHVQGNRPQIVRELSSHYGNCLVVLKGHQTAIGNHRSDLFVNCSGNPHLAQGGSGDLLSGFLGGLLAQPTLQSDPLKTICYGVWQHGAAADVLQARRKNWTIEDLASELGNI